MEKDLTLMVVEDESLLLRAIVKKLENLGVDCVSCVSGKQAIDYLLNLSQVSDLPDAVWLDYHLKDMDGIEFVSNLKNHDRLKDLPIFVISNTATQDKVRGLMGLGVKKYIVKADYRLDELVKLIKEFL